MLSKNKKEAIKEFIEFHKEIEEETYLEDKEEEKEKLINEFYLRK